MVFIYLPWGSTWSFLFIIFIYFWYIYSHHPTSVSLKPEVRVQKGPILKWNTLSFFYFVRSEIYFHDRWLNRDWPCFIGNFFRSIWCCTLKENTNLNKFKLSWILLPIYSTGQPFCKALFWRRQYQWCLSQHRTHKLKILLQVLIQNDITSHLYNGVIRQNQLSTSCENLDSSRLEPLSPTTYSAHTVLYIQIFSMSINVSFISSCRCGFPASFFF